MDKLEILIDNLEAFMEDYYEHCGSLAKAIKNIGTFIIIVLTIICLRSYIKEGDGIGSIIGSLFVLWIICGLGLIVVTIVVEAITRKIKKD